MSENNQEVNVGNTKSTGIADQLLAIRRELIIGFALIVVTVLAFQGYHWLEKRQEIKANEAYYFLKARNQITDNTENLSKKEVQDSIRQFIKDHASRSVAKSAALDLAKYYESIDNFKAAYETLSLVQVKKISSIMDGLYKYRLAVSMQKNQDCQQAISVFDEIINSRKQADLIAPSMLQKALCLENIGKKDEAMAAYENLISTYGDTDTGKKAEKYLILLKMGA
tara:strand:- start:4441 stop:5115 length:675 start_codon:yes stop_codon:yes gene_type:complete